MQTRQVSIDPPVTWCKDISAQFGLTSPLCVCKFFGSRVALAGGVAPVPVPGSPPGCPFKLLSLVTRPSSPLARCFTCQGRGTGSAGELKPVAALIPSALGHQELMWSLRGVPQSTLVSELLEDKVPGFERSHPSR